MRCVWGLNEWRDSDSKYIRIFFLTGPAPEPLGMIINLIIKHLLPAAPALSILCGPLGTLVTGDRKGTSERGRWGGGGQERGRRSQRRGWTEPHGESKRGHRHIAGFFHTSDKQCVCFVWESLFV